MARHKDQDKRQQQPFRSCPLSVSSSLHQQRVERAQSSDKVSVEDAPPPDLQAAELHQRVRSFEQRQAPASMSADCPHDLVSRAKRLVDLERYRSQEVVKQQDLLNKDSVDPYRHPFDHSLLRFGLVSLDLVDNRQLVSPKALPNE